MALISNGTTIASGGNVQAPTLTGNLPALNGSSLTNLPSSAPTSSQVGSANAGLSAGAVGTYAFLGADNTNNMGGTAYAGDTRSGSLFRYISAYGNFSGTPSGTWRCMGYSVSSNSDRRLETTTVWMRVS